MQDTILYIIQNTIIQEYTRDSEDSIDYARLYKVERFSAIS